MKKQGTRLVQMPEQYSCIVSDFSGREIKGCEGVRVTHITCRANDGGTNSFPVFDLDLLPEEMNLFQQELRALVQSHVNKRNKL